MLDNVVGVNGVPVVIGTLSAGAVGVPWTRETTWLVPPVTVSKTTCGTVTAVLMTWTVEDPGIVAPWDGPSVSVHGTVTVVINWMVVTGAVGAGGAVMVKVVAPVTIAGFCGTNGAQIPWKKC